MSKLIVSPSELGEMLRKVEYRVVPITRYQVTRYEEGEDPSIEVGSKSWAGTSQHGEFDNAVVAYEVGYALAASEQVRLGWPVGDGRMQYPKDDPRYLGEQSVKQ